MLNYAGMALQALSFVNGLRESRATEREQQQLVAAEREQEQIIEVALEEYRQLRAELRFRTGLQNGIFALNAIALLLGVALGASVGTAAALGFALAAPLLGLLWIHNRLGAVELRTYLAERLLPGLQQKVGNTQVLAYDGRRRTGGGADYHGTVWLAFLVPAAVFVLWSILAATTAGPGLILGWVLAAVLNVALLLRYVEASGRL